MIYGYCRVSTKGQNIERQIRNILKEFPDAKIFQESYTGMTLDRPEFKKLLRMVEAGDTIVFDSISRLSRDIDDGLFIYKKLQNNSINLVFLKEPCANTECFVSYDVIEAFFKQTKAEHDNLVRLTREGIQTARLNGKQIGGKTGAKLNVKKAAPAKAIILKYNKDFGGTLNDKECMRLTGVSRNTYYKYKRELKGKQES